MAKRALRQVAKLDKSKTNRGTKGKKRRCGLCGNTENLVKTECCDNWICDDEDQYVMFSFAQNSCMRNHRRYTLCGNHYMEDHAGKWQDCEACKNDVETEMYVYYGTNEFNFEKLKNPPAYKPTYCHDCNRVIRLGYEGYSVGADGYLCEKCSNKQFGDPFN